MAPGELTILRCREIARILKEEVKGAEVNTFAQSNTITLTWPDGTKIVIRPISISPVK